MPMNVEVLLIWWKAEVGAEFEIRVLLNHKARKDTTRAVMFRVGQNDCRKLPAGS